MRPVATVLDGAVEQKCRLGRCPCSWRLHSPAFLVVRSGTESWIWPVEREKNWRMWAMFQACPPLSTAGMRVEDNHRNRGNSLGMTEQQYGGRLALLCHGATIPARPTYPLTIPRDKNKLLSWLSKRCLDVPVNVALNYYYPIPSKKHPYPVILYTCTMFISSIVPTIVHSYNLFACWLPIFPTGL